MTSYGGRRGTNLTQFLNSLQSETPREDALIDDDLALFTNTQFMDFDAGRTIDYQTPPVKSEPEAATTSPATTEDVTSASSPMAEMPASLDFMQDFSFSSTDFNYQPPSLSSFSEGLGLQSLPASVPFVASSHGQVPFVQPTTPRSGEKRRRESVPSRPLSVEEESRIAAEEDKRRRNTAASARFRIKKKQREQALEKHSKEMSERVVALEGRIQQLETENKWLKGMILEKNGGNDQIKALLEKGLNAKNAQHDEKDGAKMVAGTEEDNGHE